MVHEGYRQNLRKKDWKWKDWTLNWKKRFWKREARER